jgi:hypothetical protein
MPGFNSFIQDFREMSFRAGRWQRDVSQVSSTASDNSAIVGKTGFTK